MNEKRVFYLVLALLVSVAGLASSFLGRIHEKDTTISVLRSQLTIAMHSSHRVDHYVKVPMVVKVQGEDRVVYEYIHDGQRDTASTTISLTTTAEVKTAKDVIRPGAPMWEVGAGGYRVPDIRGQSWTGPYINGGVNIGLLTVKGIGLSLPDNKWGYGGGLDVRF